MVSEVGETAPATKSASPAATHKAPFQLPEAQVATPVSVSRTVPSPTSVVVKVLADPLPYCRVLEVPPFDSAVENCAPFCLTEREETFVDVQDTEEVQVEALSAMVQLGTVSGAVIGGLTQADPSQDGVPTGQATTALVHAPQLLPSRDSAITPLTSEAELLSAQARI